jgi:hypothetical protein
MISSMPRLLSPAEQPQRLHLIFSELSFLDSAALSGLLIMHHRASQAGVTFHLDHRPPSERVKLSPNSILKLYEEISESLWTGP